MPVAVMSSLSTVPVPPNQLPLGTVTSRWRTNTGESIEAPANPQWRLACRCRYDVHEFSRSGVGGCGGTALVVAVVTASQHLRLEDSPG
jgi:hypothetical protein